MAVWESLSGYNAQQNFLQPVYQSQRAVLHSFGNLIKSHDESLDEGKALLGPLQLDPKAITVECKNSPTLKTVGLGSIQDFLPSVGSVILQHKSVWKC